MLIPNSEPIIIKDVLPVEKHLAGQHDQSFHAGGGRAAAYKKLALQRKKLMDAGKTKLGLRTDNKGHVINPDATGGYKAHPPIPETISFGGETLTPDHSLWHHLESDGKGGYRITAERQALHNKIIEDTVNRVPKSSDPTFTMLGGGPASGKSSAIKTGAVQVPDKNNAVHINADDVKAELPEMDRMAMSPENADFFEAASFAHEESSYLAKKIQTAAFEGGRDVVLDGTGDSSIDSLSKKVNQARAAGYKVNAEYVSVPTDVAIGRANARSLNSAERRFVPASIVAETHASVSSTFQKAAEAGLFDKVNLWDNNQEFGKPPTLVGTGNSQGFSVANQPLYDAFIAKGGNQ
jgi:predicted ABC-type ATPase